MEQGNIDDMFSQMLGELDDLTQQLDAVPETETSSHYSSSTVRTATLPTHNKITDQEDVDLSAMLNDLSSFEENISSNFGIDDDFLFQKSNNYGSGLSTSLSVDENMQQFGTLKRAGKAEVNTTYSSPDIDNEEELSLETLSRDIELDMHQSVQLTNEDLSQLSPILHEVDDIVKGLNLNATEGLGNSNTEKEFPNTDNPKIFETSCHKEISSHGPLDMYNKENLTLFKSDSNVHVDDNVVAPQNPESNTEEREERIKSERMRIALEKMKEARIQKLLVKVFNKDDSSKTVVIDERMTARTVMKQLIEKNHFDYSPNWVLVEELPSLFMERTFEEHEKPCENMSCWTRDTTNQLRFIERKDKYALFKNPQHYLLPQSDQQEQMQERQKQTLIDEFFSGKGPSSGVPDVGGVLYIKSEGKSWSRKYCVLRSSGLYLSKSGEPKKGKKVSDLTCLVMFEQINLYLGRGWKKKFKAPFDYGFALKHPAIQVKSKHIRYFSCEDFKSLMRWTVGIRLAKYGKQLLQNFEKTNDDVKEKTAVISHLTFRPEKQDVIKKSTSNESTSRSSTLPKGLGVKNIFESAWQRADQDEKKDTSCDDSLHSLSVGRTKSVWKPNSKKSNNWWELQDEQQANKDVKLLSTENDETVRRTSVGKHPNTVPAPPPASLKPTSHQNFSKPHVSQNSSNFDLPPPPTDFDLPPINTSYDMKPPPPPQAKDKYGLASEQISQESVLNKDPVLVESANTFLSYDDPLPPPPPPLHGNSYGDDVAGQANYVPEVLPPPSFPQQLAFTTLQDKYNKNNSNNVTTVPGGCIKKSHVQQSPEQLTKYLTTFPHYTSNSISPLANYYINQASSSNMSEPGIFSKDEFPPPPPFIRDLKETIFAATNNQQTSMSEGDISNRLLSHVKCRSSGTETQCNRRGPPPPPRSARTRLTNKERSIKN